MLNITVKDNEIVVKPIVKKRPFIRLIIGENIEISVDRDTTIMELLYISKIYDATLFITTNGESSTKTQILVNDNGHDYINYDKNEFDRKTVIARLKEASKF